MWRYWVFGAQSRMCNCALVNCSADRPGAGAGRVMATFYWRFARQGSGGRAGCCGRGQFRRLLSAVSAKRTQPRRGFEEADSRQASIDTICVLNTNVTAAFALSPRIICKLWVQRKQLCKYGGLCGFSAGWGGVRQRQQGTQRAGEWREVTSGGWWPGAGGAGVIGLQLCGQWLQCASQEPGCAALSVLLTDTARHWPLSYIYAACFAGPNWK